MDFSEVYDKYVSLTYHLYNSLFLTLPYPGIQAAGPYVPILYKKSLEGLAAGKSPEEILQYFFDDHYPTDSEEEKIDFLFRVVQYIERQVVLFDAVEDAAFEKLHDLQGKGTLSFLIEEAKAENSLSALGRVLSTFGVRVVLTAHPTQFYPGHILSIITDMEQAIRKGSPSDVTTLMRQLGLSAMYRRNKPTPLEEAISLIWYLENIFYDVNAQIHQLLLEKVPTYTFNPKLITTGFWPGGDRDGNPTVKSDTTIDTCKRLKESILRCYLRDVRTLKRKLTFPGIDLKIREIELRLQSTIYRHDDNYYNRPDEVIADLQYIREELRQKFMNLYCDDVDALIRQILTFGFHFAPLDIRQDSRVHRSWAFEFLSYRGLEQNYKALSSIEQKLEFWWNLECNLLSDELLYLSPDLADVVRLIRALPMIHIKNGPMAIERYIISNTQNAEDLAILKFLLTAAGSDFYLRIQPIPLFETVKDLDNSEQILTTLFNHRGYRQWIAAHGNRQTIMLGFSDGTKDGGYLKANLAIYQAKVVITRLCRTYGIEPIFFDGRGGPPARGGGDTHLYYAAQGADIACSEIQLTIQGQTISSKFGNHQAARYNLEQLLTAGVGRYLFRNSTPTLSDEDAQFLYQLADKAYSKYESLKNHPAFSDYLLKATPLPYYAETNISSRPAKRGRTDKLSLDDLRAIPFVGTWAQMKQNVPGYYGFGTALQTAVEAGHGPRLKDIFRHSRYFRALVLNSMQSLAKTRFELTAYLRNDQQFAEIWFDLKNEADLTRSMLLYISGYNELLEEAPTNRKSITMREEMILPLLIIQQYALMQVRKLSESDPQRSVYQKLIVRCFFGNINASRNSA
ncbi:MAG: phosphoenolpyruvate carboxylase [Thermaurantimonas sp.]|uniref:phosphoenolpyruvate carboxylase n=1 Tax=Thermaurantimonas sp. TaxID=2681568 RepID=UPI0039194A2A